MSRLSRAEFRAMNSLPRRLLQKHYELPRVKRMGIRFNEKDVLEIGCGSGYGATLILKDKPRSYIGIDMMEEQIALAQKRGIQGAEFRLEDAANMQSIEDASKDLIVIFGALHHIPEWRIVLSECHRVLRHEGEMYVEEPAGKLLELVDGKWPHWGHPKEGHFSLQELTRSLTDSRFRIINLSSAFGFGFYRVQRMKRNE
jgi:ubiquinone/menaquinone biosynthesis C-methylase UbiE